MEDGLQEPPPDAAATDAGSEAFDGELVALGFAPQGASHRGGRRWALAYNGFLTFVVHDRGEGVVLSWSFALGEYLEERGWRMSVTDTSVAELYPQHDVRVARDPEAVRAELARVLISLRLDLGDPAL